MVDLDKLEQSIDRIFDNSKKYCVGADYTKGRYILQKFSNDYSSFQREINPMLDYLAENEPSLLPKFESVVMTYEKTFEEIKEKVEAGKLEGRVEHDFYVPEGDPNNHPDNFDDLGEGGIGLLLLGGMPLIFLAEQFQNWSQNTKNKSIRKMLETTANITDKMGERIAYIGVLPIGLIIGGMYKLANIGRGYTESEKSFFQLEEQKDKILNIVDYLNLILNEELEEREIIELKKDIREMLE